MKIFYLKPSSKFKIYNKIIRPYSGGGVWRKDLGNNTGEVFYPDLHKGLLWIYIGDTCVFLFYCRASLPGVNMSSQCYNFPHTRRTLYHSTTAMDLLTGKESGRCALHGKGVFVGRFSLVEVSFSRKARKYEN